MRFRALPLPLLLVPLLALAGCSGGPGAGPSNGGGAVRVVTSTDVWGDVVAQVGGDAVEVETVIDDPDRDPHEYEADARDRLAVSRARLVVINGGGYDPFMDDLTADVPATTAAIDAVDAAGVDTSGEFNEHLWYDVPAVGRVATRIADELVRLAPDDAAAIRSGLGAFRAKLRSLEDETAAIRTSAEGRGVAITEPVPLYLTDALGLVDRTPAAFSEAVEEGQDVPPAVLQQQLALFADGDVALLAWNEQTSGPVTEQVLAAAERAGVPSVAVRETLPEGEDYVAWIRGDLREIRTALER